MRILEDDVTNAAELCDAITGLKTKQQRAILAVFFAALRRNDAPSAAVLAAWDASDRLFCAIAEDATGEEI